MADHDRDKSQHKFTPEDVQRAKSDFDPQAAPAPTAAAGGHPGAPHPDHNEVAAQTRLQQQSRPDGRPDREDRLTNMGRGDQTHG
jgi:hypothetical protein